MDSRELTGALIEEYSQAAGAVDHGRIGIAVAVQIGPRELTNARDPGKGMNRRKGAIAVVAEYSRLTALRAKHDVQIAIGLHVNRPCAGVGRIGDYLSVASSRLSHR